MKNRLLKLEKIRKQKGLSRRELSEISGVSEATIVALELGINDIYGVKLATLVKLATMLNIKVIDLVPDDIKEYIA